jgi:drug/metabolite transporter (DMT)-like permease
VSALLALLSAVSYGTGDFFGGIATRRAPSVIPVIVWSHLVGLALVVALVPFFAGEVTARALLAGGGGGVAGAVGFAFLYRGLAFGRMAVVAPITALASAAIPLGWGLLAGERPGTVALAGAAVGLAAIPLVAAVGDSPGTGSGIREAVAAGVGFAVFFIALDASGATTGVVPLLGARLASLPLFGVAALVTGTTLRLPRSARGVALGAGLFDMAANGLFLAATRTGFLVVAAVLVSLYPAVTIVLARLLLHERVGVVQRIGLGLAAVGIGLMAAG